MRAMVEGELHDTETAECIGCAGADQPAGDPRRWQAGLYRHRGTGQYFLAGVGGPLTRFGQPGVDDFGVGKIVLLDVIDAEEWANAHLGLAEIADRLPSENAAYCAGANGRTRSAR